MYPETEKEKDNNCQIDPQEEAPTIGLNGTVVVTGKSGLRLRLKLSKPRNRNEEVAFYVNGYRNAQPVSMMEEDYNEEVEATDNEAFEECGSSESKNSQLPTCAECGKTFPSQKSLYGHLRSHPDRGYRGANRPACGLKERAISGWGVKGGANRSACGLKEQMISGWGVKARRGRTKEQEEMDFAAETLMLMSLSKPVKVEEALEIADKTYQCSICNKSFSTHQALGGHRASHNKHRNNSEAEALEGAAENGMVHARERPNSNGGAVARAAVAEHRCKTCNETFATGQALGGHMRRHYNGTHATESVRIENHHALESVRSENHALIRFDLNEAPPLPEEERVAV